jgi:anti-anti-sigma factor
MGSLDLEYSREEKWAAFVVRVSGNIDTFTHQALRDYLQQLPINPQLKRVVVDLSRTDYISSSGWSVLMSQSRSLRRLGGSLVLANMKDEIKGVYERMNVESLLPCADVPSDVKELLDKVGG